MSDVTVVKKGDVVKVEYDAWIVDSDELFDTTNEDHATDAGINDENVTYGSVHLLVGGGRVFPGLDEAIEGAEVGEEIEVNIPFDQAAGERNPKLVELHSIREFTKQDIDVHPGMEVSVGNRRGLITAVTAGRVRVDFNHRLAGKDLRYKFTVTEVLDGAEEKVMGIIQMDYGTADDFEVTFEDGVFTITIPDVCKYDQKWSVAKYRIVADVREAFDPDNILFVEQYETVREEPVEDEAEDEEIAEEELSPEEIAPEDSE